ncbi:hypothetical protein K470DRAFT_260588 [Piedraia hortae CBS 480.64]|uniref:Integral membrane protein n=1 Tax=Piedraia hortae CBS 480.64 TaxID=1314780 RepID=A0A6A7BR14_9PEZI|nr:hypothetical protein K470DRAFT_260588 [Piedraia hortae CBS 480.64]
MFIGESGCWLVVFLSWLFRKYFHSSDGHRDTDASYAPVATSEVDEGSNVPTNNPRQSDNDFAPAISQTPVDPTNVVAKPFEDGDTMSAPRIPLTGWRVFLLALPAVCDICGTTLMNVGLLFVAASIYQMTRGALVLFVGLFSVIFLKRRLGVWKWAALVVVVSGVVLVGLAGVLEKKQEGHVYRPYHPYQDGASADLIRKTVNLARESASALASHTAGETILGVTLIAAAQIFTASQFVLEEGIMEQYTMDPIQVVGWEGIFGFLVTLTGMGVLYPLIGRTPAGKGGYFDIPEGFHQVFHNRAVAITSLLIMISIGGFNFFGLSVTRVISATSRSTIDTCRTLFIWMVSLGLGWEKFKWLQVAGFILVVYGTSMFNDIISPPTAAFWRTQKRTVFDGGEGQ